MKQDSVKGTSRRRGPCRAELEAVHLAASQGCVFVSQEAAGPLKAKMVSYKLQFVPSVSFLPLKDHRAFKIEPELTSRRERDTARDRGHGQVSVLAVDMTASQHDGALQCSEVVVTKLFH